MIFIFISILFRSLLSNARIGAYKEFHLRHTDFIKLKLSDSKNRETTQILAKNESCLIVTGEGINQVQIVNKKGKIEGSFTINANVIYSQIEQNTAYGTLLSDVLNKELLIVKSKGRKVDFKFGTIAAQNGMLVCSSK